MASTVIKQGMTNAAVRKMLLGKVIPCKVPDAARIIVQSLQFDDFVHMFFPKHESYFAHDPERVSKSGDIVLIEELPKRMTREITHKVLKVIYPLGDITDPISGKKCVGLEFRDDMAKIAELWGTNPMNTFDYDKAPPRGWQEGKKDWSHKPPYRKWHEFPDKDQNESSYS